MPRTSAIGRGMGFTLLELMVVLGILVLIAVFFPVALDRALPGHRLTAALDQITSTIREAQADSVISGKPVALRLQEHGLDMDNSKANGTVHALSLPPSIALSLLDAEGQPLKQFVVYPDGSAQGVRLELADSGHHGAVMVSTVTGRISSVRGP